MAAEQTITLVGNLARDPELRFTASGKAVVGFGLAVNDRKKQGDEWVDDVSFIDVTCWEQLAQNVSDSLSKGTRVIVFGQIKQDQWETDSGEKRSKIKVVAQAVGIDLRWATAEVTKNERSTSGTAGGQSKSPAPDADPFSADDV